MAKTYRKPYTKSKRFDRTCRNHGSCSYCKATRTYREAVQARIAAEKLNDFYDWEEANNERELTNAEKKQIILEQERLDEAAAESYWRLED